MNVNCENCKKCETQNRYSDLKQFFTFFLFLKPFFTNDKTSMISKKLHLNYNEREKQVRKEKISTS